MKDRATWITRIKSILNLQNIVPIEYVESLWPYIGQELALKVLLIQNEEQLELAMREINTLHLLSHSPYVLSLLASSVQTMKKKGLYTAYILTPYYTKKCILNMKKQDDNIIHQYSSFYSEKEVLTFFQHVCRGIHDLHSAGRIHGDIKPMNVLQSRTGTLPVIVDLGSTQSSTTLVLKNKEHVREWAEKHTSRAFRAPELYSKKDVTYTKIDVWSLGCMLYCMLYGEFGPFETPCDGVLKLSILAGSFTFPSSPFISLPTQHLIQEMLQPCSTHRPSLTVVLQHLEGLCFSLDSPFDSLMSFVRCKACGEDVQEDMMAIEVHSTRFCRYIIRPEEKVKLNSLKGDHHGYIPTIPY